MPGSSAPSRPLLRRGARIAAVIAWCGVIFAASARPDLRVADDDTVDFVVRKLAHMSEYAVLALLALHAIDHVRSRHVASRIGAWLAAIVYAVTDEYHQTFVRGRHGAPRDVAIDAAGAAIGLLVAGAIVRRSRR